jgi:hypothetical protein
MLDIVPKRGEDNKPKALLLLNALLTRNATLDALLHLLKRNTLLLHNLNKLDNNLLIRDIKATYTKNVVL